MATATLDPSRIAAFMDAIERADETLQTSAAPSEETQELLSRLLSLTATAHKLNAFDPVDPYLVIGFLGGLLRSMESLLHQSRTQRKDLRVALEQMRQALRDMAENYPIQEDRDDKAIAQWLVQAVDARQQDIADLLEVSPRTLQRWLSDKDETSPEGDDAMRLRIVARIVNQLRHALTGPGVLHWFGRPHPELKGATPSSLLGDPASFPHLQRIASAARSSRAS